ncbi:MAG: DsrE family protein [Nitrospiraceae bacterium]|nr:DsrE family protein [Nitrospiraceae bacterium]
MDIGFLITRSEFSSNIFALADAALKKGHSIRLFMTDEGVKLLENKKLLDYAGREKVEVSFCNYSSQNHKVDESSLPSSIISATQYQNSLMHNECDRVLVF